MEPTPRQQANKRRLKQVQALLAKAESSQFPEEAAAFTAKAYALMATYAIDQAMLDATRGTGEVVHRLVQVPDPYAKDKFLLLAAVAEASHCDAVLGLSDDYRRDPAKFKRIMAEPGRPSILVGFEADLDIAEMLFTSLLLQAINMMLGHGSVVDVWGRNRTRSFRRSFLIGFVHIVSERLAESRAQVEHDADQQASGNVLPVLLDRRARVEQSLAEAFPQLQSLRTAPISNGQGLHAGMDAGQRADLGVNQVPGRRPQLTP